MKKYDIEGSVLNLADAGPSLGSARTPQELDDASHEAMRKIGDADLLVVGVPTFNGGYPGMFKHFFDLLSHDALVGKPLILVATGGSERHSLMIEYQLRPLLNYFRGVTLPTAIYGGGLVETELAARIERVVDEFSPWMMSHQPA
jgi:FMN reductase